MSPTKPPHAPRSAPADFNQLVYSLNTRDKWKGEHEDAEPLVIPRH